MPDHRSPSPSLNAQVAEWVAGFSIDAAPAEVVENTKLRILDLIGVMIAASRLDVVAAARRAASEADGDQGDAHALTEAATTSPANAAFANGIMSAVLEFDDTHIETNIHPTGAVLSAALPECERRGLPGRRLIEAVLVGSELLCRLGLISPVRMHEVGFHPSAVYGIFGAVYGLARLYGLPPGQIRDAIGTAASLSAGSISSFQDGASTKTLHVGMAAAAAVRAVALAGQGISGPDAVFEGRFGWFRSHVQSDPGFRFAALTHELGRRWEVLNIASKAHPCAYTLMPFIAATLILRERHGIRPEAVEAIHCDIMPRSFPTVCEPVEDKRRPRTSWHGRISLQHTVAEALVLGRMGRDAYAPASLRDPVINAIADRVVHRPDMIAAGDVSRSRGTVSIRLKDGREFSHTIEDMPGTRGNPISRADYVRKFRANIDGMIPASAGDDLAAAILRLDQVDDVGGIFRALRR